jgi:RNA polymerase sigma-70 factor (ECF subfamily)
MTPENLVMDDANDTEVGSDNHAAIHQSIAGLTSAQREAIELTKVQGLSLKEASAVSGKSIASLKALIHRATKALRRSLTKN